MTYYAICHQWLIDMMRLLMMLLMLQYIPCLYMQCQHNRQLLVKFYAIFTYFHIYHEYHQSAFRLAAASCRFHSAAVNIIKFRMKYIRFLCYSLLCLCRVSIAYAAPYRPFAGHRPYYIATFRYFRHNYWSKYGDEARRYE